MIGPSLRLPPGRSLTDVWPHLPLKLKIPILRAVEEEAHAVRREAAAARRCAEISLLDAWAAGEARLEMLDQEAATFRVGRPRRRVAAR